MKGKDKIQEPRMIKNRDIPLLSRVLCVMQDVCIALIPAGLASVWFFGLRAAILIAVSVAIETMRQLESQMLMRHYKGFLE